MSILSAAGSCFTPSPDTAVAWPYGCATATAYSGAAWLQRRSGEPPKEETLMIDWNSILEAAYEAREECPELFMILLDQQFVDDGWHDDVPGVEKQPWHASELSKCTRALMYGELGVEEEPLRPDTNATFDIGKFYHCLFQFGLAVHPEYVLVGHEMGGVHKSGVLAARADAVFWTGPPNISGNYHVDDQRLVLTDLKTEKPGASKNRHSDAVRRSKTGEDGGKYSAARPDHCVQVRATTEVVQDLYNLAIQEAWAVYVDRGWLTIDPQPVELKAISDQWGMSKEVFNRLRTLDEYRHGVQVSKGSAMPPQLSASHWNCQELVIEGQKMGVGKYCQAWSYCRNGRPIS